MTQEKSKSLSSIAESNPVLDMNNGSPKAISKGLDSPVVEIMDMGQSNQRAPMSATSRKNLSKIPASPGSNFVAFLTFLMLAIMILGLALDNIWLGYTSAVVVMLLSIITFWPSWGNVWTQLIPPVWRNMVIGAIGVLSSITGLIILGSTNQNSNSQRLEINWDAIGALGELIGALGQIMIAILGVYVAWRQYVISKDLTIQQNRITQQQTIDAYFQGVSDLALDDNGFLEDWPQERAIAEGRTASIIRSVDAEGKAKILRFLSQSKLITPIKRDRHLGRAILDGEGGYEEDRAAGIRVIALGVMLAGADIAGMDLRWTDLSEANCVRADFSGCELVKANLSRTILYEANMTGVDLKGARLFYGNYETATPRTRSGIPDYETGEGTGTVIENADFTGVRRLSDEQRYYCCTWGGENTRKTIPGGCEGIPNKLGR